MAKIPYLVRRENVFYFRLVVSADLRESTKVREFNQSLKTECRKEATRQALKLAAHYKAALYDLRIGKAQQVSHLIQSESKSVPSVAPPVTLSAQVQLSSPPLSVVITDFLKHYDQNNKVTLAKLNRHSAPL